MDFPTFILTLLSGNWLFFNEDEIVWDGKHHHISGIQVNGAQVSEFMNFVDSFADDFDDIQDVVNHFIGFLCEVEKDEDLIIPRDVIAPGVYKALRDGDLTGITLSNLAACGAAFQVKLHEEDSYIVIYDTRLAMGIPAFYSLMARLIWDLRQCLHSKAGVPFNVAFMGARNFDANEYLDDVPKSVLGSQDNPGTMSVSSCPEVIYDNGSSEAMNDESKNPGSCFAPFYSGFDDPDEMQADEELFEASLLSLMRAFPITRPIEGTHVHGRAARIEDIHVGDSLVLASDWQTEFFNPVGIEVFNEKGESLGYLSETFSPSMSGNRELACLFPYIKASVKSVTPLSQRRKNARHALMDIELVLDESLMVEAWNGFSSDFLKDVKAMLGLPKPQRVSMSHTTLQPSQLQGSIDTSEAVSRYCGLEQPANIEKETKNGQVSDSSTSGNQETEAIMEEVGEREETLSLLQLFVLTGQLSGIDFPQDLIEKLEKAQEGDESIDLEELANQLNGVTPEVEAIEFSNISFSDGKRAEGRRFSIAIPDGWTVLENYQENDMFAEIVRPFVAVPHNADPDSNLSLSDRVVYSSLAGNVEADNAMLEYGIPATRWALVFYNSYDKSDELASMKPTFVWDEEIEGVNTTSFVAMKQPTEGINGLEFYVYPYAPDHNDFLHCIFTYENDAQVEEAKELVRKIARSIVQESPVKPTCESKLEQALTSKVSVPDYESIVLSYAKPFIGLKQLVFDAAQQKYYSLTQDEDSTALLLAGAKGIAYFTSKAVPIFSKLIDAYLKQQELNACEDDLQKMRDQLNVFESNVFPTSELFSEDPKSKKLIEESGVFNPSLELQNEQLRFTNIKKAGGTSSSEPENAQTEQDVKQERIDNANSEQFRIDALDDIIAAYAKPITSAEYVSISEAVGFGFMSKRQEACDSATSPFNSDEDNVTAMSREFAKFNPIIARYVSYMLELVDAQAEYGVDHSELMKMAEEVEEFIELTADSFSCGNDYLDSVANNRAPVTLPKDYDCLKRHLAEIKRKY